MEEDCDNLKESINVKQEELLAIRKEYNERCKQYKYGEKQMTIIAEYFLNTLSLFILFHDEDNENCETQSVKEHITPLNI